MRSRLDRGHSSPSMSHEPKVGTTSDHASWLDVLSACSNPSSASSPTAAHPPSNGTSSGSATPNLSLSPRSGPPSGGSSVASQATGLRAQSFMRVRMRDACSVLNLLRLSLRATRVGPGGLRAGSFSCRSLHATRFPQHHPACAGSSHCHRDANAELEHPFPFTASPKPGVCSCISHSCACIGTRRLASLNHRHGPLIVRAQVVRCP